MKHFKDMYTNLHTNLQSRISSKRDRYFRKRLNTPSHAKALVEEIRQVTTPAGKGRLYPVIIGEHGTGKTSLIKLAVNGIDKPKGVIYVDVDINDDSVDIAGAMRKALE
jgi:polynucleotide 5'-kinase involved in rRNA processing